MGMQIVLQPHAFVAPRHGQLRGNRDLKLRPETVRLRGMWSASCESNARVLLGPRLVKAKWVSPSFSKPLEGPQVPCGNTTGCRLCMAQERKHRLKSLMECKSSYPQCFAKHRSLKKTNEASKEIFMLQWTLPTVLFSRNVAAPEINWHILEMLGGGHSVILSTFY